jgi:hypothetical protein
MIMIQRLHALGLAALATLSFTQGCANAVGCDFREAPDGRQEDRCQERRGFQALGAFGATCDGLGGETIDGGCPTEDIVAGCDLGGDGDVIDWYYPPKTRADVEAECEGEGEVIDP